MVLYFITGNKKKFNEVKKIIHNIEQIDLDLPEIQSLNSRDIIEAKLKEAQKHKSGQFIVEDTSLYLNCLNKLRGPLIKFFIESIGDKGIFNIADKFNDKKAVAKKIIGYSNNKEIKFFEGVIEGTIINPRVPAKFGWDSIFQPSGFNITFSEMSIEEKNRISMRKKATEKLKEYLDHPK